MDEFWNEAPGSKSSRSLTLLVIGRLMPLALMGWIIHTAATEYGSFGVVLAAVGLGALVMLVLGVKVGMSLVDVYHLARFGAFLGFVSCLGLVPLLLWLGYDDDPQARRQHDARFAAIDAAMLRVASRPLPSWDRLDPAVVAALEQLPDHPLDRTVTVGELIHRLDSPDPIVRAEVVLALGRYEGMTTTILPLLVARVGSADPRMRAAATVALAGMRPWTPDLERQVFARLADADEHVQDAAVTAVAQVAGFLQSDGSIDRLRAAADGGGLVTRRKIAALIIRLAAPH